MRFRNSFPKLTYYYKPIALITSRDKSVILSWEKEKSLVIFSQSPKTCVGKGKVFPILWGFSTKKD